MFNSALGSSQTLSCTLEGSPPDTFTWMKGGTPAPLTPTLTTVTHNATTAIFRSDYTISSVTTSDTGIYSCTVSNPIGSDSADIAINGKHLNVVNIMAQNQSFNVEENVAYIIFDIRNVDIGIFLKQTYIE